MKRELWTEEEDQILLGVISSSQVSIANIQWPQILCSLQNLHPGWARDSRQCRERWNYCLKRAVKQPPQKIGKSQALDLQKFLNCFNQYGKKWSLIRRYQFPNRSQNQLKNFFNLSLRKGLRNLNFYNRQIRERKVFRLFGLQFLDRLLAAVDEKRVVDLIIFDIEIKQLSQSILNALLRSGQNKVVSTEDKQFYQNMHMLLTEFGKKCRFKKLRRNLNKEKVKSVLFHHLNKCEGKRNLRQSKIFEDAEHQIQITENKIKKSQQELAIQGNEPISPQRLQTFSLNTVVVPDEELFDVLD